ncbi:MAG: 2-oxoacid:acceptor oxidoreductase family protein [Desulfurococcales archaeon]|nr:2-oxoacid:acceptor oxidoreductase family protein [Desulfurococcales archaeon]
MLEVRWHGRGGQGAWTAANLLAMAAMLDGKHVQSFPAFGPERSGAPLMAFTRISEEPIEIHSMIYEPDIVVVLDPTLLKTQNVTEGLKKGGTIVVNYSGSGDELLKELKVSKGEYRVFYVPATKLAMDILGRPIMNTAMVGALLKANSVVSMGSVEEAVKRRFSGKLAELNNRLIKKAMEETKEVE